MERNTRRERERERPGGQGKGCLPEEGAFKGIKCNRDAGDSEVLILTTQRSLADYEGFKSI